MEPEGGREMTGPGGARVLGPVLDGLRALGVPPGGLLIVHSSFKALGLPDASPADVIATLLECLGPDGTLMMPSFTYSFAGIWNAEPFDIETTPAWRIGVLPETLRAWPGTLRSAHTTFSVVALGPLAREITSGRENASGLGAGSAYDAAHTLGARILLLGVTSARNSMIHFAEAASGLPCNDIHFRDFWGRSALVRRGGELIETPIVGDLPGCSANYGIVDGYLLEHGLEKTGLVAAAPSILMDAQEMVSAVTARLALQPDWLFCDSIICEPCTLRRRRLREHGLL